MSSGKMLKLAAFLFAIGLVQFALLPDAGATLNFCGGTNARNLSVSYGASNFMVGLGINPINGNTLRVSKTKGLAVRHPFQNNGADFFRCPNAPTVSGGVCSLPWKSILPPSIPPQQPTDCGCPSYLQADLSGNNVSPPPTLPQDVYAGFWDDNTITNAHINDFQFFPNPAYNASYSKLISLTNPGAFASTLYLMYHDQTVVSGGNGVKEIEVLVPYRPNLVVQPGQGGRALFYAAPHPNEVPAINCLWVANLIPVALEN